MNHIVISIGPQQQIKWNDINSQNNKTQYSRAIIIHTHKCIQFHSSSKCETWPLLLLLLSLSFDVGFAWNFARRPFLLLALSGLLLNLTDTRTCHSKCHIPHTCAYEMLAGIKGSQQQWTTMTTIIIIIIKGNTQSELLLSLWVCHWHPYQCRSNDILLSQLSLLSNAYTPYMNKEISDAMRLVAVQ